MRQYLYATILAACCSQFSAAEPSPGVAQLAQTVTQAITEDEKIAALVAVAQAMHVGVYRASSGEAIVHGAERASSDFYLYDFELGIMARSLLRGDAWSLTDMADYLNSMGLSPRKEVSAEDFRNAVVRGVQQSLETPSGPHTLIPLLVRELGLARSQPYDLAEAANVAPESIQVDALQRWLILADILLPVLWKDGPVLAGSSKLPAALGMVRAERLSARESACAAIGNVMGDAWEAGKIIVEVIGEAHTALFVLDGLHGSIIAYGVEVRAVQKVVSTHYGPPGHTPEAGKELKFQISVTMLDKLADVLINCGWLVGLEFPDKGGIGDVEVVWAGVRALRAYGRLSCGALCTTKTDPNGIATLTLTPRTEAQPGRGIDTHERGSIAAISLEQARFKNKLGAIAVIFGGIKGDTIEWDISWHRPPGSRGRITISETGSQNRLPEQAQSGMVSSRFAYEEVMSIEPTSEGSSTLSATAEMTDTMQRDEHDEWYGPCASGEPITLNHTLDFNESLAVSGSASLEIPGIGSLFVLGSDGSYRLEIGALGVFATGTDRAKLSDKDYCNSGHDDEEDETAPVFSAHTPIEDLVLNGKVDPEHPDTISGSYSQPGQSPLTGTPTTVVVEWNFTRDSAQSIASAGGNRGVPR